jgi:hypothetical protein
VKFSRFASLLFLFCCSHVFILVLSTFEFDFDFQFFVRLKGIENEAKKAAASIREDENMDM